MNTEEILRSILVDLYRERLSILGYHYEDIEDIISEEDIEDIIGEDELTFINEHLEQLTSNSMVDNFYENVFYSFYADDYKDSIFYYNDECMRYAISNYLIAYIIRNYIIFHYNDPEYDKIIKTMAGVKYGVLRIEYYENEAATKKMIRCLIHSLANPDICKNNYNLMKQNNDEHLIKNVDSRCQKVTISINNFLRILFNQHFNDLICSQCNMKDAVRYSILWLFNTEDVNDTFKKMNLSDEQILSYKKYLRKLIIADVYEDAMNNPIPYADDLDEQKQELAAVGLSTFAINCGKDLSDFNEDQIMHFIYHYIRLFQDEVKTLSNRDATIESDRLKIIKKYNSAFMFD